MGVEGISSLLRSKGILVSFSVSLASQGLRDPGTGKGSGRKSSDNPNGGSAATGEAFGEPGETPTVTGRI